MEAQGVLTVIGVLPSPIEELRPNLPSPIAPEGVAQARADIVRDLCRRERYLLTLKGRPPFRLAGIALDRSPGLLDAFDRQTV